LTEEEADDDDDEEEEEPPERESIVAVTGCARCERTDERSPSTLYGWSEARFERESVAVSSSMM
jgi:hypothetical protein